VAVVVADGADPDGDFDEALILPWQGVLAATEIIGNFGFVLPVST
jgi:hypothetical protein